MTGDQHPRTPWWSSTTVWIMAAVFAWGCYLAIGAWRAPGQHGPVRAAIVFGCTLAFLGLWLSALAVRRQRLKREG